MCICILQPQHRILQAGIRVSTLRTVSGGLVGTVPGRPWVEALSPVRLVQLHDPLLQLSGLVWGEAELADIVAHMLLGVIVAQLSLHSVGAQQGMCDEGAGQPACDDVCPQLQAQVVSGDGGEWAWTQGPSLPRCPPTPARLPPAPSEPS